VLVGVGVNVGTLVAVGVGVLVAVGVGVLVDPGGTLVAVGVGVLVEPGGTFVAVGVGVPVGVGVNDGVGVGVNVGIPITSIQIELLQVAVSATNLIYLKPWSTETVCPVNNFVLLTFSPVLPVMATHPVQPEVGHW
jgi:hypothetical protein